MGLSFTSNRRLDEARAAVREQAWALVNEAAETMQVTARTLVEEAEGTGFKWPALPNRSSSPYAVPVNQSGAVAESIEIEEQPLGEDHPACDVFSDSDVLLLLETGTPRQAPRPFMTQASYAGEEVMRGAWLSLYRALEAL